MNTQCINRCTQLYLDEFNCILDCMIEEMTGAKFTNSISRNFIVQMIPHHRAAVQMSQNLLRYTRNSQLRCTAQSIITEQTKSIENMQAILRHCGQHTNSSRALNNYRRMNDSILETMFYEMRSAAADCSINCDFIREMLPLQMGAVRMSENTLQYRICGRLRPILNSIITSQKKSVCQLRDIAKTFNCSI